jgi:hypothetical protein
VPVLEGIYQRVLTVEEYKAVLAYLTSPVGKSVQLKSARMFSDPVATDYMTKAMRKATEAVK